MPRKQSYTRTVSENMWAVYIAIAVLLFFFIGGGIGSLAIIPILMSFAYRQIARNSPNTKFKWVIIIALALVAALGIASKILGFTFLF